MLQSDEVYEIICAVADLSGSSKQSFLRVQDIDITKYLLAAYNPYTKYYITKCRNGDGVEEFDTLTWHILDQLSQRKLSGKEAQLLVNHFTEEMTPRSSELFRRILNKDLRMGMGIKSINKVFPGLIPVHDVMLAKATFEPHRLKYPCFGSPKIDGVRAKFKNGVFYSRNGHPYKGLEHLQEQLRIARITEELDGELTVPGVSFQVGSGWIRSDDLTPDAEFKLIELPAIKDSFITRLIMMRDLHLVGPHIHHIPRQQLESINSIYEYYKVCRKNGYEGSIITPFDYEYVGSRSWNWMKLKPLGYLDAKVISIYEGKGKYVGQMGGAVVMFEGKPNKVGGGWSDKQRKAFWEKPIMIIDKMIEVHYMEKTDDGNMRHSRFFDFRPDKQGD